MPMPLSSDKFSDPWVGLLANRSPYMAHPSLDHLSTPGPPNPYYTIDHLFNATLPHYGLKAPWGQDCSCVYTQ